MSNRKPQAGGGGQFDANRDGAGEGNTRDLELEKEARARARGRTRSTERGWLEGQLPEKRHSGLLKADFEAAIELLLEAGPREYTDTFLSAVHMADVSDSWARAYMRVLLSSQGPYMSYPEGDVLLLDHRTTLGSSGSAA